MVVVRSRSRNRIKESKLINISLTVGVEGGFQLVYGHPLADGRGSQGAEETDPLAPNKTPSVLSLSFRIKTFDDVVKSPPSTDAPSHGAYPTVRVPWLTFRQQGWIGGTSTNYINCGKQNIKPEKSPHPRAPQPPC